jgi:hypothetical protein
MLSSKKTSREKHSKMEVPSFEYLYNSNQMATNGSQIVSLGERRLDQVSLDQDSEKRERRVFLPNFQNFLQKCGKWGFFIDIKIARN